MPTCRTATPRDLPSVAQFYRDVGYGSEISEDDSLLVAEDATGLVAAVRLCEEFGVVVLRGMHVAPDLQRAGVGTQLLAAAAKAIGGRACFCVPYSHLQRFYAQIGFRTLKDAEAPGFLRARAEGYRANGYEVVVMGTEPGTPASADN